MRECLRSLVLGFDGTAFEKVDMFLALKAVDGHLRKSFKPKQTTLHSFFSAEWIQYIT